MVINDYNGNVVQITNISQQSPITVAVWGPGFNTSDDLPQTGQMYGLAQYQSRFTVTPASYARVVMSADKSYTVFATFAGPDPQVYCVNAPSESKVPPGYTQIVADNNFPLTENWMGQTFYIINLSVDSAHGAQVSFTPL